jgi:predicted metal-dependent phosphoesterase TrpH
MTLQHDLHSHSLASDGTLSASALVDRARRAGVDVLALTDHDTTDGIEEARQAAQVAGLRLVAGVEISVTWQALTIHVLGLHVDPACAQLQEGLLGLRGFRNWRAREIGRRLAKAGIVDTYEEACSLVQGRIISRTHFAQVLVQRGQAASVRDVFKRYLVPNKPGHVSGRWAALEDAVAWIRAAGGLPVLAHPARYPLTASKFRRLLDEFKECGGLAIEVVSGSHSRDDTLCMAAHCRSHGLYASRGSDYHGPEKPWVELGRLPELPQGCRPLWEAEFWPHAA